MKYSAPAGSGIKILSKADEIKIPYEKITEIENYVDYYSDVSYVIIITEKKDKVNFKILQEWNSKIDLTVELDNLSEINKYAELGIKWYWKYPVQTYYDLDGLRQAGAAQALIDAPLFFDLPTVKKYGMKVRVIPNLCYRNYIPRANGICGCWILPQHMHLYEDYIDIIEFDSINNIQLNKLLEVYKDKKIWTEDCSVIFKNFNYKVFAGAIPDKVAKARLSCKQRCAQNKCSICKTFVRLEDILTKRMIERYKDGIERSNS